MSHDGGTRLGALKARHGQKSIGAFRAHYGPNFAKGCAMKNSRDVLHKLDEPTLTKCGIKIAAADRLIELPPPRC